MIEIKQFQCDEDDIRENLIKNKIAQKATNYTHFL